MSSRRNFIKQTVLGGSAMSLGLFPQDLLASGELIRLTVMHSNDMHYQIDPFPESNAEYSGRGGIVRLATLVANTRAENPNLLLLDAGDMFQGTPYFNYFKGDLILKLMSQMGYDAGTIGNHEFDNGLNDIFSAFQHAKFPIVSSNYDFSDTILCDQVKNYHILKKGKIKIGVYGLGIELDGLVGKLNYGNTIYLDPLKTALKMEHLLKMEYKCDLIICLSHLGFSYKQGRISDTSLAPLTKYTDLFIGGHTHTSLEKPLVLKNADGLPVIINQAGWGTLSAGKIEFLFDRVGRKQTFSAVINNL